MSDIIEYPFLEESLAQIKKTSYGKNWPVIYMLEDGKRIYIGESTRLYYRCKQHVKTANKKDLKNIHIIHDDEFNMSATKDIESWLIEYMAAEGSYKLLNNNSGLSNHNYFDREKYKAKFEVIWNELKKKNLVAKDLIQIQNSDLFKYSPYKTLTGEQLEITDQILDIDKNYTAYTQIIHGKPGTGKTILAIFLLKKLVNQERKVALVVPMVSLRKTLKNVFRKIPGLKSSMVIGPSDLVKETYDVLIVDEAHRLKRRKNIVNYKIFDEVNIKKSLNKESTELDWIIDSCHKIILFYDEDQSIRPSDIRPEDVVTTDAKNYYLSSQLRVAGGEEYMTFINDVFERNVHKKYIISNFDFELFENISEMKKKITQLNDKYTLSRLVAGFAWPWVSKNGAQAFDIEIGNERLKWNSTNQGWINSANSINEVGCIHTVQGYDLNYIGVIIGPELSYDHDKKIFIINKKFYFDTNGHRGIDDPKELERYILNIYKVLLTRGIKGAYVYIVDDALRAYFKEVINHIKLI